MFILQSRTLYNHLAHLRGTFIRNAHKQFQLLHTSSKAMSYLDPDKGRTYEDASRLLESLQSNRTIVSMVSNTSGDPNSVAIPEMVEWTRRAGYDISDLAKSGLRCIHVAGTKGKGSVCTMVESILSQYQKHNENNDGNVKKGAASSGLGVGKIGVYTSPHLVTVRERIRIDGSPISEPMFTQYFFDLWDRFTQTAASHSLPNPTSVEHRPFFFRYLTILAFHIFIKEGVKSAVIECGIGGEYDSTNILPPEAITVSAITRLGIDHPGMLGNTLESIAWHKAGIMKPGVPVFTVTQAPEAELVLRRRAEEKGAKSLSVVPRLDALDSEKVKLGLLGEFQKDNASLAIAITKEHLKAVGIIPKAGNQSIEPEARKGLELATLPGRCQVIEERNILWHIDGAHTVDSVEAAAEWFSSRIQEASATDQLPPKTLLIFNQQDRDVTQLLQALLNGFQNKSTEGSTNSSGFTYAAFCTNEPFSTEDNKPIDLEVQKQAADAFSAITGSTNHKICSSAEEAVSYARTISEKEKLHVLVTGSLYLVGAFLKVVSGGEK
ncbi:Mur ligase [Xylogone sp. PMI_703]|nr:Mur ligase [Xylogone sp. PMI_703]